VVTFFQKKILTTPLFSSNDFSRHEPAIADFLVLAISKWTAPDTQTEGDAEMKKWAKVVIPIVVVLLLAAWYAFRPERLVVNRQVDEAMPAAQGGPSAQPLESGRFYSILHPTEGIATIYQMGDGTRVLRLTSFSTSNGPDVHVYMVAADDAKDAATVEKAGYVDLGVIKGNIGDQNYTLGSDLDLTKYHAVSIWCKRFSVNFGAAALKSAETSQNR
jgi:hypothetical protein